MPHEDQRGPGYTGDEDFALPGAGPRHQLLSRLVEALDLAELELLPLGELQRIVEAAHQVWALFELIARLDRLGAAFLEFFELIGRVCDHRLAMIHR